MPYYGVPRTTTEPEPRVHVTEDCPALIGSANVMELKSDQAKRRKPCRWCMPDEAWQKAEDESRTFAKGLFAQVMARAEQRAAADRIRRDPRD